MPSLGITSVEEVWDERGGSINNLYERRYTRVFEVVTADRSIAAQRIYLDSRIPQLGAFYTNGLLNTNPYYEEDRGAFVGDVKCDPIPGAEGAGIYWKVTVQYQPWSPSAFGSDPVLWPLRVQFGGERTERVIYFDKDGNAIRNSAGDRFSEPVTVDDHITTLIITRNELVSAFDPDLASAYSDTVNAGAWNGFAAGHCKMGIISTGEEKFDSNNLRWYYTVTYPVQVRRTPWVKELLDQGYNELNASGDAVAPVMNDGQPVADPVCLDGAGRRIAEHGSPVTLTFDVEDAADWSGLNIDLSVRLGL